MKKLVNKLTAILLTATLVLSLMIANISCIYADESQDFVAVNDEAAKTAEYVLNALDSTELGVYNYKEIILIMRSGIDFGDLADRYINLLESNITDGKLIINDSENITMYAAYLIVLALHGDNALDADESMVDAFNNLLASYTTAEELNTAVGNPYYYDFIVPAVFAYGDYMENADSIKELLCDAIMINYEKTEDGCGINYWGLSCDTNAAVIPALNYFSGKEEIAAAVADAVAFNESLIMEDGGSKFDNGEYSTASNADSTGAALYLYSILNNENRELSFQGLMNFKIADTPGAYTYYGSDNMYATVDALKGLVAYKMAFANEGFPFDVTKEVSDILTPEETTPEQESTMEEDTTAEEDTTEETDSTIENNTTAESDTTTVDATEKNDATTAADTKATETTTASNASTKTGDNGDTMAILFLLCAVSTGIIAFARKKNAQ